MKLNLLICKFSCMGICCTGTPVFVLLNIRQFTVYSGFRVSCSSRALAVQWSFA